ncbi:MAG: hypothetical protein Q7T12_00655 [Flavobacterium sp.]|nr:hypothetical protein [Flavobacterium sp.]
MGKIIFWDETTTPDKAGGTIRIQELLTKEFIKTREVLIIGNKNGSAIHKLLIDKVKFEFIEPTKELIEKNVTTNDLIIVFWIDAKLNLFKKINPYILFWNVYPFLSPMNSFRKLRYFFLIKEMYRKNSFVIMDAECKKNIYSQFKMDLRNEYLRIPINVSDNIYKYKIRDQTINISYIGRGDNKALWKIKALIKMVKDVSNLINITFKIHIFTDSSELFEKELKDINTENMENIEIYYHFGFWGETLSKKLIEVSDFHYSMGTSMLEGAKLGIPTVIADAGWNDFPNNYKYRWFIDDVENYAGKFIDGTTKFQGFLIKELINDILDEEKMLSISNIQHGLVKSSFSSKMISENILSLNPKGKVKDVVKYFPKMYF